jgi:hypothetical protein
MDRSAWNAVAVNTNRRDKPAEISCAFASRNARMRPKHQVRSVLRPIPRTGTYRTA